MDKLEELKKIQKEIILLCQSLALLQWDQEVNLPEEGAQTRAEQVSLLSSLIHERFVSDKLYNLAKDLEKEELGEIDSVMIKRLIHDIEREKKLPTEFVREMSGATSRAFSSWKNAKEQNDFSVFEEDLEKIVELKRKEAEYLGYGSHPYDALLDQFEEGMTTEKVSEIFGKLKTELVSLIKSIESSEEYGKEKISHFAKDFSYSEQFELAKDVSGRIGLKGTDSRIDTSPHPFTISLGSNDVRITTGIRNNPLFSFTSTTHESGHALYELNLPKDFEFTVLHDVPSLGIHESQSRFWENMIGRGKPFWNFYFDKFRESLRQDVDFNFFYKWFNRIFPGFIRIESDEVHYCLHIILRFEIEKGLLDGSIEVKDLPRVWNEKFREYFGVAPEKASEGVLQDVHWSHGDFGYFPTYAIGSIYAAQIYETLKNEIPEIEEDISKGDFSKIRGWLKEKIHKHGRMLLAEEIISKVCGEGLNPESYINYLKKKYSEIYNLE